MTLWCAHASLILQRKRAGRAGVAGLWATLCKYARPPRSFYWVASWLGDCLDLNLLSRRTQHWNKRAFNPCGRLRGAPGGHEWRNKVVDEALKQTDEIQAQWRTCELCYVTFVTSDVEEMLTMSIFSNFSINRHVGRMIYFPSPEIITPLLNLYLLKCSVLMNAELFFQHSGCRNFWRGNYLTICVAARTPTWNKADTHIKCFDPHTGASVGETRPGQLSLKGNYTWTALVCA